MRHRGCQHRKVGVSIATSHTGKHTERDGGRQGEAGYQPAPGHRSPVWAAEVRVSIST